MYAARLLLAQVNICFGMVITILSSFLPGKKGRTRRGCDHERTQYGCARCFVGDEWKSADRFSIQPRFFSDGTNLSRCLPKRREKSFEQRDGEMAELHDHTVRLTFSDELN